MRLGGTEPWDDRLPDALHTPEVVASERLAAGDSVTVADVDGAGVLHGWWTAMRSSSPEVVANAYFEIRVDGEDEPSVVGDFNTPGMRAYTAAPRQFTWYHGHAHGHVRYVPTEYGEAYGGFAFRYPVPYSDGLSIRLVHPGEDDRNSEAAADSDESLVYYSAPYVEPRDPSEVPDVRLRTSSALSARRGLGSVRPGDELSFLDTTGTGRVAGFYLRGESAASERVTIENSIDTFVDDAREPTIAAPGSEDFFLFTWADVWESDWASPPFVVGTNRVDEPPYVHNWGVDLLEAYGGIPFDESIRIRLRSDGLENYGWALYYYEST